MTVYSEKSALTLLTGAVDSDGDQITVSRIDDVVISSWPHTLAVGGVNLQISQSGVVTYDDGGNTSSHPADGQTAALTSFTFRLTDGIQESDPYTAFVNLEGTTVTPPPSGTILKGMTTPSGPSTGDVYADPNASGANNGTSWANAYTNLQSAINAVNAAGPGSVLIARGTFRQQVEIPGGGGSGGTPGNPITITCEGTTPFTVTAAELHTNWSPCSSQADALGNANWSNMVTSTIALSSISNGEALALNLFKDGVRQELAIDALTNTSDARFFPRNDDNMHVATSHSNTSITSASVIGAYSAGDLAHSYVLAHFSAGNNVAIKAITSHSGNTINFSSVGSADGKFAIWNAPKKISGPGQWAFAVQGANVKVVAWFDNTDYSNVEYSARDHCVNQGWANHWHIHGMICRQWSGSGDKSVGFGAKNNNHIRKSGITLEQCRFTGGANYGQNMGISLSLWNNQDSGAAYVTIDDNQNCQGCYIAGGSGSTGTDNYLRNFIIDRVGGSGLRPHIVERFRAVDGEITEIKGSHANGASIYQDSYNVLFLRMKIRTGRGIGVTHQESNNLWFINCDVQCPEGELNGHRALESNGTNACRNLSNNSVRTGVMRYLNCTTAPWPTAPIPGGANSILPCKTGGTTSLVMLNCIGFGQMDPLPRSNAAYDAAVPVYEKVEDNLNTGLTPGQTTGTAFFTGGAYVAPTGGGTNNLPSYARNGYTSNPATAFADYVNDDVRPKAGGPADGNGADPSAYFPTSIFAGENWDIDILGNGVVWSGPVHKGAYQETS